MRRRSVNIGLRGCPVSDDDYNLRNGRVGHAYRISTSRSRLVLSFRTSTRRRNLTHVLTVLGNLDVASAVGVCGCDEYEEVLVEGQKRLLALIVYSRYLLSGTPGAPLSTLKRTTK
jgi:hypothetical protein